MKILNLPILAACLWAPIASHAADPAPDVVIKDMKRVADWQLANPSKHAIHDWTQAPFYLGLENLSQVSGDLSYRAAATDVGQQLAFGPGPLVAHADDHAVLQTWLELYRHDLDVAKLRPTVDHFDKVLEALATAPSLSASGGTFTWCWCDALFMSPAVWVHLSNLTGNPKYLEWADREWWTTTDILYDPEASLYYRDNRFFDQRTPSGKKVFWARGNGWVVSGIAHVLDYLPAKHPSRERYLGLYHDMMKAVLKLQNADGLWRTSLLEPDGPRGESSGSAFFVHAMAWGLNRGLLDEASFRPAMIKGWQALANNIQADGMLGYVQVPSDRPDGLDTGAHSTEVYGAGAFLLAGSELVRLLDPSKRRSDLASFDGVTLPARFLREKPRVYARFVPERQDDFAWENDLIAFRSYGPALRSGAEDSGFDAWLKRVPYPILDKWYVEDVTNARHTGKPKSYHTDHGEGYDAYKVGNTRGCGGISLWADGKLHDSNTFVSYRILENTPERALFDFLYTSKLDGKTVREVKRITVLPGKRLFQAESRFTVDGKAGPLDVAIGLTPQSARPQVTFDKKAGTMAVWDKIDGLGLGQGIAIDPAAVEDMISIGDTVGQKQVLCLARTDDSGYIRWFAGYGWEGQGVITSPGKWTQYLGKFAAESLPKPFADHSKTMSAE